MKNKLGQYFTPPELVERLLDALPKPERYASVLEPGCGNGAILQPILDRFEDCAIDAWEIDPALWDECQEKFAEHKDKGWVTFHCGDFTRQAGSYYKYVIGNPPYFEFKPTALEKKRFGEVINGRANMYAIFLKLGIDQLYPLGYLSFIVPTSMLNGAYFSALREYIVNHCDIHHIEILGDGHFKNAQQNVMIFTLRKLAIGASNDGRFIFRHNGLMVFSPEWRLLESIFKDSSSLYDLGFRVKTGTVVWNQHKEKLTDSWEGNRLLVWSHNITKDGFRCSPKKPQYIQWPDNEKQAVIAVNRVTGVGKKAYLKACLIPHTDFVCENHVNVITASQEVKMTWEEALKHLRDPRGLQALQLITGNTQVSKTELEKLFPVFRSLPASN